MGHNQQSGTEAEREPRSSPGAPPGRGGRLGLTLFRYVVRHTLRPALLAFLGLTTALFAKDLLGFSNLLINQGFEYLTIGKILLFKWIPLASQSAPFAVAIGLFVGMGRLSGTLELTAMESCGMAPRRLMAPVFFAALVGATLSFGLSYAAVPWSARELHAELERVAARNPTVAIQPGATLDFGGWKLEAREVSATGRDLRGVLLFVPSVGDTIFAERGEVRTDGEGVDAVSLLFLEAGAVLRRAGQGVERVQFEALRTQLPRADASAREEIENPLRAMTRAELDATAADDDATALQRHGAALEAERRLGLPFAAAVFGLLVIPLFLHLGRPQGAAGAMAGLVLTLAYYGLLQFGEGLVYGGRVPARVGVWLPNAFCFATACLALVIPTRPPRTGTNRGGGARYIGGTARLKVRRLALDRYVAGTYLRLTLAVFAVLFSGYLLTDLLERLDWFERYDATLFEVAHFYSARAPLLASRMVPMAFLAGAALTVSQLALRGELIAIRACGIAAIRGLAPIFVVAALSVPGAFVLGDWIVPRSNARADAIKVSEIKDGGQNQRNEVWYRAADKLFRAEAMNAVLGWAEGLSVYEIGATGLPESIIDAHHATRVGESGVWELEGAIEYVLSTEGMRERPAPLRVDFGEDDTGATDTMHLGTRALALLIREAEADGYDTTRFLVDYHVRLANPWACLVLPASLLFLALAARSLLRSPALVMLSAIVIGIAYVLLTDTGAALGYGGAIPPSAGGWGATGLFTFVGLALASRNFD